MDTIKQKETITMKNDTASDRKKKKFSVRETFGIDLGYEKDDNEQNVLDKDGKPIFKDKLVTGYEEPTEFTPKIDPTYVFSSEETKMLLLGFELKSRLMLTGGSGVGKTSLLEQVAARLNYSVVKINFDGNITRQDLIGEWIVKGKDMQFQYGILVHAFKMPGCLIVLDEYDSLSSECSMVLQRPLEPNDSKILLLETGGELISLHPDNVIAATANTRGMGDDSGLYTHGTRVQNFAQLNRFGMNIRMKYLEEKQEVEMLGRKFPDLKKTEVSSLVKIANLIRDGYANGEISVPLSPRDLIQWSLLYQLIGFPIMAAKYAFMNRLDDADTSTVQNLLQREFSEQK